MSKKILSAVLALCMALSCLTISGFTAAARTTESAEVSAESSSSVGADYGLADNIQDGVILHCFDWKYTDITAELPNIAKAGFTAVQTSPAQANNNHGTWYWLYQPRGFYVDTNDLGTKAQLQTLCTEAEKYGIKVVVDVVANHLEGEHRNIVDDLKPGQYWHNMGGVSDWNDRYQVTHGEIGMADLATENSYVQSCVRNLVRELKDMGVDGIRWDAAKHIGLPSEGDNFWPAVTQDGLYNYGEILDGPGGDGARIMKEYSNYISITDSIYSQNLRNAFAGGNVPDGYGNWTVQGVSDSKMVYWAESHDTYANGGSGSQYIDQNKIDRAYAVAAARVNATSLYYSRPYSTDKESIKAGQKGSTHFTSAEVAEVNKFHNEMIGKADYYSNSNGCAVVTRKDGGAVIVKGSGSGSVSVSNGGGYAKPGTYVDHVSGSTFTVTSSTISGNIGQSGIAVIYDESAKGPSAFVTPGSKTFKTDTMNLTLNYKNATSGQYSIDGGSYKSFTDGQTITIGSGAPFGTKINVTVKASDGMTTSEPETYTYTKVDPSLVQKIYFDNNAYYWSTVYAYVYADDTLNNGQWPGTQMSIDPATGYYVLEIPEAFANGYVIFTESYSATNNRYPGDGAQGMPLEGRTMIMKANHEWVEYQDYQPSTTAPQPTTVPTEPTTVKPTQPTTVPTEPTQPTQPTTPQNRVLIGDVNLNGSITISDATEVQLHASDFKTLTGDNAVAADVDMNGVISVKDATAIQFYIAGLDSDSHCGEYVGGGEEPTTQPATAKPTEPVTEPATAPAGNYIYYKNTNNWNTVKAYYWSNDNSVSVSWPGVDMENLGNGEYRIEVPAATQMIIFNNGGSGNGNQTSDLRIEGFNKIYDNGVWRDYGSTPVDPTVPVVPTTPVGGNYVYFENSNGWGGVNAYYWSDDNTSMVSWPGVPMESAGNNVYRLEYPSGASKIIFNDGNSQTDDINLEGPNKIFRNGSWSDYTG